MTTTLGDICEETETIDPSRSPDAPFRYVDISSVDNTRKRIVASKTLLGKDAPSRARNRICSGDVIVSTTRPNLNAVAQVPPELHGEVCSTGFCVLRPSEKVSPDYLFFCTQTPMFVGALAELARGANYPAVSDRQVLKQRIVLPDLPTQRRIATRLKEQMAAVEQARQRVEEQLESVVPLRARTLEDCFAELEVEHGCSHRLGEVLRLRREVVHPRDKPKGAATFVGLEHVASGTGQRIGSVSVEMSELTGRKPQFRAGDIVYGYLRPYLNKVWLADFDGLCSVDQYVYEVDGAIAEAEFIAWFMRSPVYLRRAPIDLTPGQLPRLRTDEVAAVELALPPLATQREIAARLCGQFATLQQLQSALSTQRTALEALPGAFLREAFGNLQK